MDKQLTKGLVAIAGIILISVCLARGCASSDTVADYAAKHESEITPMVEADEESIEYSEEPISDSIDGSDTEMLSESVENTDSAEEDTIEGFDGMAELPEEPFYIEEITDELKARMNGKSYAEGIDESIINYSLLRHVVIKYYDFNDEIQNGEIVCNEKIAEDILEIFKGLFDAGYQLERVQLIDEYDADDDASMDANNTSCFNYRVVDNTTKLSYHAYGLAIDVNPFYNPYVQMRNGEEYVCPTGSVQYADRDSSFPYKIDENDLAYKLFKEHGFIWGGDWNSCKDYQHFEKRFE